MLRVQLEGKAEVREGGDGAGSEERFEAVEGILAVWAPMKDRVFSGQGVQWSGNSCEVSNVESIVPGETQKGADFCGVLRRTDVSDGG